MKFFTTIENHFRAVVISMALAVGLFAFCPDAFCQQQKPLTDEEKEEQLNEFIQEEVTKFENVLKLEDWQTFYVDSILTHDYHALQKEIEGLSSSKISNYDIYSSVQDKWAEATYVAFKAILNEEQWAKYLKTGASREKRARDKRKAKMSAVPEKK